MASNDFEIFDGKSFKDLCKDIYDRSDNKHEQLDLLISELRPYIHNLDDAQQVVPMIQGYLEISVRNDEQLVKLSQVVQRLQTAKLESGGSEILTEAEKDVLFQEIQNVAKEVRMPITAPSGSLATIKV